MTTTEKKAALLEWAAGLITAIGTYLSPLFGIIAVLLIVSSVDHFAGVWRARKKKEKIEVWRGIKQTFSKILVYSVICFGVHSVDHFLLNEFWTGSFNTRFLLLKGVTLLLCYLELKSINKSYKEVKGVDLMATFYDMIKGARDIIEKVKGIKDGAAVLLVVFLFAGCGLVSPEKRHEKLVNKYPYLHQTDSVEIQAPFTVYIDRITKDTIFKDRITPGRIDTVRLEKERLKVVYYRDGDTVYLSGECAADTITKTVTIKSPVKYFPLPLKWWQKPFNLLLIFAGLGFIGWYLQNRSKWGMLKGTQINN